MIIEEYKYKMTSVRLSIIKIDHKNQNKKSSSFTIQRDRKKEKVRYPPRRNSKLSSCFLPFNLDVEVRTEIFYPL